MEEKVGQKVRKLFGKKGDVYPCTVIDNCDYQPKSMNQSNCVRHVREQHPLEYNALELGKRLSDQDIENLLKKKRMKIMKPEDDATVVVRLSRQKFVGGLIKLVTLHSCPFSCLNWEGMKDVIEPGLEAFKLTLNRNNMPELVSRTSEAVDHIITQEVNRDMLALKFDTTTKMNRSVLGISVQFFKELTLTNRCIGVIELTDRHTAENLMVEITTVASKFGVAAWQYYTATIDNARNGIKAIDCIREKQEEDVIKQYFEPAGSDDDEDEYDPAKVDPKVAICQEALNGHYIECVRCGAHTINLVVKDATKDHQPDLKKVTSVVKAYRRSEYSNRFRRTGTPMPPIPNATRWNHYYLMARALCKNRDFFTGLGVMHPELDLLNSWILIEEYLVAFEPLYDASVASQAAVCLISDFHLGWLKAYGRVIRLDVNNRFKEAITASMQARLKTMMSSIAYRAVLYLDPRLNFAGSRLFKDENEKMAIVEFMSKLWKKIESHEGTAQDPTASQNVVKAAPNSDDDFDLDEFITETVGEGTSCVAEPSSLESMLSNIQFQPRIAASDTSFNLVHYCYAKKIEDERLWKIARVVLSAAATQVDIEQDFSQFNLVYTSLRSQLSGQNTDNILKVKLNRELLPAAIPVALGHFYGPSIEKSAEAM